MQIHELNEAFTDLLKGAGGKIKSAVQSAGDEIAATQSASNVARGQAQQQKTQAQAARYAERLKQQGYQAPVPPTTAQPAPVQQPIQIGGQTIQPSDPNYAKIMGQTAAATPTPPTAQPTKPAYQRPAGPVRTQQAGPVYSGQAQSIMTSPDFQAALRQMRLTTQQFEELKQMVQSNPGFANTLLKQLGLKR